MLYITKDKEAFRTRKEARKHCRNLGLGNNIKKNYIQIPQFHSDHQSLIRTIGDKEYRKKAKRFQKNVR